MAVTDTQLATLDGTLHPIDAPLLRADDLGFLRGDGVFETTLALGGVPRDLDEHLERLAISAKLLDFSVPADAEWQAGIRAVIEAWRAAGGAQEMSLRLIATRGPEHGTSTTCLVMGSDIAEALIGQRRGVRIRTLARAFGGAEVAGMPWLLPGAKTLSYAVNMAAIRHAKSLGDDDVVFVGSDGLLLEGPTATVILVEGDTLTTPRRDGVLDSITARRLFAAAGTAGWTTRYADITPDRLLSADGAYLVSSVRLLAPMVSVDGTAREVGPRTAELAALLGGTETAHDA